MQNKIYRFKTTIQKIEQIAPDVKHLVINTPQAFSFAPGQFVSIILSINGEEIRRPYSIASKPYPESLELCIKILPQGKATPTINKLQVGDTLEMIGPMGHFILKESSYDKNLIFIATGTGITPFRSMAAHLLETGFKNKITLLVGYRYEEHALYEHEFTQLQKTYPHFSYQRILSRPTGNQEKGHVQKLVEKNLDLTAHYYICGLKEMVNQVKDLLLQKGIEQDQIFFEKYD